MVIRSLLRREAHKSAQQSITRNVRTFRQRYEAFYDKHPYAVSGLIIGTKAIFADLVAQAYEARNDPDFQIDMLRNVKYDSCGRMLPSVTPRVVRFTAFCCFYVGSF